MYHFKICNRIKLVCFLKFIVHKMNSEMVKSRMLVLIRREKTDVTDADVVVGWILQPTIVAMLGEREREKIDVAWARVRYSQATTGISLKKWSFVTLLIIAYIAYFSTFIMPSAMCVMYKFDSLS
jgi:hypothetical protein